MSSFPSLHLFPHAGKAEYGSVVYTGRNCDIKNPFAKAPRHIDQLAGPKLRLSKGEGHVQTKSEIRNKFEYPPAPFPRPSSNGLTLPVNKFWASGRFSAIATTIAP